MFRALPTFTSLHVLAIFMNQVRFTNTCMRSSTLHEICHLSSTLIAMTRESVCCESSCTCDASKTVTRNSFLVQAFVTRAIFRTEAMRLERQFLVSSVTSPQSKTLRLDRQPVRPLLAMISAVCSRCRFRVLSFCRLAASTPKSRRADLTASMTFCRLTASTQESRRT